MLARLRTWAAGLKRDVLAIYFAARDPRVPWPAKLLAAAVAAYALSPIDLIPDFIPVLGYLDDLVIVPIGIMLVVRLIPPALMAEHRAHAERALGRPPRELDRRRRHRGHLDRGRRGGRLVDRTPRARRAGAAIGRGRPLA